MKFICKHNQRTINDIDNLKGQKKENYKRHYVKEKERYEELKEKKKKDRTGANMYQFFV